MIAGSAKAIDHGQKCETPATPNRIPSFRTWLSMWWQVLIAELLHFLEAASKR